MYEGYSVGGDVYVVTTNVWHWEFTEEGKEKEHVLRWPHVEKDF